MNKLLHFASVLLLLTLTGTASGATIYKCRQAGGVTSYQDKPCPGRQIGVLRTPTTAAMANSKPTVKAPAPVAPGSPGSVPASKARPAPTGRTTRPSFKCMRPDGSYYYSGDARPKRTLVDLPSKGNLLPIPGAPAAPPGKTWAQDQCTTATRAETCQYYQEQIAYTDAKAQRAKGGEAQALTREGKRLRAIHNHRCQ